MSSEIYEKFDTDLLRCFVFTKSVAIDLKCKEITLDALAIGIILSGPNVATEIFKKISIKLEPLLHKIKEKIEKNTIPDSTFIYGDIQISNDVKTIIKNSIKIKNDMDDKVLGVQHVLIALCVAEYFAPIVDINKKDFKKALSQITVADNNEFDEIDEDGDFREMSSANSTNRKRTSKQTKKEILNLFFVDLTQSAKEGKLDPVIGREKEIEQIISVLCRKRKNNPVLVGSAGVGKTCVIEGLAQRIAAGAVPESIKNKKILMLNLSSVVADTQYRGQFEEKMNGILQMFKESKEYVCFIDEMHTILGAGNAMGTLDAGNILKPALARGDFKCIGATTEDEYYKFVSRDGALERRFQKIIINEPSMEDTKKILYGIKDSMEKHHKCIVSSDAIDSAVELADRYVRDKYFPDKAIDLIDDACSRFSNIERVKRDNVAISREDIAKTVSDQQSIPYNTIINSYTDKILILEEIIRKDFIGQEEAVKNVCQTIKNAYVGLRSLETPVCSFIFAGPSGTGKTHLAEKISESIFPHKDSFIRINMTEFTESHTVSRLIGSPPGYVGFGEKNQLTDKVLRRPHCLILLDEIDKAHPDVVKLFMQILSRGTLTDAKGREVSFKQSIVIMTTNMSGETSSQGSLGFGSGNKNAEKDKNISLCKKMFGVEFINRINSIIVFNNFNDKEKIELVKLFFSRLIDKIKKQKNIDLKYNDDIIPIVIEEAKKLPGVNANPIEGVITKGLISNIISDCIVESKGNIKKIELVVKDGKIVVGK